MQGQASIHIVTQVQRTHSLGMVVFFSSAQYPAWHYWHQQHSALSLSRHAVSGRQPEIAALRRSRLCDLKTKTIDGGRERERIGAITCCGWSSWILVKWHLSSVHSIAALRTVAAWLWHLYYTLSSVYEKWLLCEWNDMDLCSLYTTSQFRPSVRPWKVFSISMKFGM